MAAKIEKIYQITLAGEQDLIQKMKSVNQQFEESKKRWKELKTETAKGLSASDMAQYKLMLQQAKLETERLRQETVKLKNEAVVLANQNKSNANQHQQSLNQEKIATEGLKQETIKLRNESISLTNQNKQNTLSQRQAREEANNSVNAYKLLNQQYKEAKNNALNLGASLGVQSPKFREAATEAKKYYNQLKQIESGVGIYGRNVGNYPQAMAANFSAGFKKYFEDMKGQLASFAMGYVGFQAVLGTVTKMNDIGYHLSDNLADLQMRLKGSKEDADAVFESLKKIDTRTSLEELTLTASLVAKKGVAKEEIEGITAALDKYFIVAGKEAGNREEGVASIIKLISIFYEDKHVTKERVEELSAGLVTLQNKGVATGRFMINLAERIGAVKGITGVTLPSVLGFGAALEQLGQRSEVAGTAGIQIITKMFSDIPKYARMAGMSVEEFQKKINANPIEALIALAENMKDGKSFEQIAQDMEEVGVRGARVKAVLGDIAGNADFMRKKQQEANEAMKNTGMLAASNATKQNTYAASIDKIKKSFELVVSSRNFIDFLNSVAQVILFMSKAITAIPFSVWLSFVGLLTLAYWANIQAFIAKNVQLLIYIARMGVANALILTATAIERAHILVLTLVNETYTLLILTMNLFGISTVRLRGFIIGLNMTLAATPWGVIIGLIAAVGATTLVYASNTETATEKLKAKGKAIKENTELLRVQNEISKKATDSVSSEMATVAVYTATVKDHSLSQKTRKEALEKIIALSPQHLSALTLENFETAKGIGLLKEYKNAILEVARAKAAKDLLTENYKRIYELEQNVTEANRKSDIRKKTKSDIFSKDAWSQDFKSLFGGGDDEDIANAMNKELSERRKNTQHFEKIVNGYAEKGMYASEESHNSGGGVKPQKSYQTLGKLSDEIKALKTELNETEINSKRYLEIKKELKQKEAYYDSLTKDKKENYKGSRLTGDQKDYIKDLEASKNSELAVLETSYTKGQIQEEEYITKSLAVNRSFHDKKIAYLRSGNAEERKQESQAQLDKAKAEREANDKLYTIRKKNYDDELKQDELDAQIKKDKVLNNAYSTDQEKLDAQKVYYEESTSAQLKYNQNMIDLENELSKTMLEEANARNRSLQQKLDEENRNNLQHKIDTLKTTMSSIDRMTDELDNEIQINDAIAKKLILEDKNMDSIKKKNELQKQSARLELQNTNAELGRVNAKIAVIELEKEQRKLTNDELREYNRLLKERAVLEGKKAQSEQNYRTSGGSISAPGEGFSGLASALTRGYKNSDGIISLGKNNDGTSIDGTEMVGYAIAQSFDIAQQAMNSYFDAERQRIERSKQIAYERIDLEKEQALRYAQSNSEKEAIDKQATEKKKKADKEAGEQLKRVKKSEARIAFLTELANIWSTVWQLGPIAGPIMGSALSLLALARYGVTVDGINSVQYKRGGKFLGRGGLLSGPSHGNGGMPVYNPETGQKVAEMEGKEGIINADSMGDNTVYSVTGTTSQIASKLNSIGGGVDWFGGATLKKFESGGIFSWNRTQPPVFNSQIQSVNSMNENSESSERLARIEYNLEQLSKEAQKKVVLNPKDVTNYQRENQKQTEIGTLS